MTSTPADSQVRAFLDRDYVRVVRVVNVLLNDVQRAEDAVSDAVERAWTRLERGESIDDMAAWCMTVAMNQARTHVRRLGRERRAYGRLGAVDSAAEPNVADQIAVAAAVRALPKRQRELTILRYFGGLSVEDAAQSLSMSAGAARSMLFAARKTLAVALGEPVEVTESEMTL